MPYIAIMPKELGTTPIANYATRPPCAICSGGIPPELLSDRDWRAELEYSKEHHTRIRPFYCSANCFRLARDGHSESLLQAPEKAVGSTERHEHPFGVPK